MRPIIIEIETKATKEKVWKAITEVGQMKKWFFDNIPNFEAKLHAETSFNVTSSTRDFYHKWKVTEVILNKKIAYTWKYEDIEGESLSVFNIEEYESKTVLTISCFGLESFPNTIPEFTRESCLAGWTYFTERLKNYLKE